MILEYAQAHVDRSGYRPYAGGMKDAGVMVAIIGTGVALAAVIVTGQGQLRGDMRENFSKIETGNAGVRDDVADLRDRVSRIGGLLSRPGVDFLDFSDFPAITDTDTPSENDG